MFNFQSWIPLICHIIPNVNNHIHNNNSNKALVFWQALFWASHSEICLYYAQPPKKEKAVCVCCCCCLSSNLWKLGNEFQKHTWSVSVEQSEIHGIPTLLSLDFFPQRGWWAKAMKSLHAMMRHWRPPRSPTTGRYSAPKGHWPNAHFLPSLEPQSLTPAHRAPHLPSQSSSSLDSKSLKLVQSLPLSHFLFYFHVF